MAGASDKARFFLEQSVSELQEYERKGVFSREEISSIAQKRSTFEHQINARGSHPSDYARYAEYEMNLDALRKKRVRRLGIKVAGHAGQRRIFFILDRATRKFHGDIGLWMQYIEYARKEKANKKLAQVLTNVLRLHPTKPELWMYAARYAMDSQADVTAARSYMQRGLRFCSRSRTLWLEYAKLEMIYIAKVAGRRRILGLESSRPTTDQNAELDDPESGMIALPHLTAEDINPSLSKNGAVDELALQNLASTPALTGAVPIAIFDAAMNKFSGDIGFAEQFFDMVAEFFNVSCVSTVLQHVASRLMETAPRSGSAAICDFRRALIGVPTNSAKFPSVLAQSLERLRSAMQSSDNTSQLAENAMIVLLPFLRESDLDPSIRRVITASLRQYVQALVLDGPNASKEAGDKLADIAQRLEDTGRLDDARTLVLVGLKHDISSQKLLEVQTSLGLKS